jgi:hypothetical protein
MLLLQNHGIAPPETLERFGGAGRYASAIDDFLIYLDVMLQAPASIAELLLVPCRLSGCGQARWRAVSTAGATEPLLATSP